MPTVPLLPSFGLVKESAYIVIVCSTGLTWTILVFLIRVFLRVKVNGPFGMDDVACAVATFLGGLAAVITLIEVHWGLGAPVSDISVSGGHRIQLLAYIVTFCYILGLKFSQLSTCFLIARITKTWKQVWVSYGIGMASCVSAVVFVFLMAFRCRLPAPWNRMQDPSQCINQWKVWVAFTIVQCGLEIGIAIAALVLVLPLNMCLKSKTIVILAFSVRLLVIAPAAVRLHYTYIALYGKDWTSDRVTSVVITQVVLHLSIVLATVPCIKPWLTVLGGRGLKMQTTAVGLPTAQGSSLIEEPPNIHTMASIDRWQAVVDEWRPYRVKTVTQVQHYPAEAYTAARRRSLDSSESSKNGIHRTDSFTVEYVVSSGALQPDASLDNSRRSSRNTVQTGS